jgi:hypothetical protein
VLTRTTERPRFQVEREFPEADGDVAAGKRGRRLLLPHEEAFDEPVPDKPATGAEAEEQARELRVGGGLLPR